MSPYRPCAGCGAPVKFRDRDLCHACHRRAARAALRRPCPRCGCLRHLRPAGICAICDRPAVPRTVTTVTCRQCGEQRRDAGRGLCNRCKLADPDWPFRYGASTAARLAGVPGWWQTLTEFAAARYHPGGAVAIAPRPPRPAGRPCSRPPADHRQRRPAGRHPDCGRQGTGRVLHRPRADDAGRPGQPPRGRPSAVLPGRHPRNVAAVAAFNDTQLAGQERDRRAGWRLLSDVTPGNRLRILRDLAGHLAASGRITSWAGHSRRHHAYLPANLCELEKEQAAPT